MGGSFVRVPRQTREEVVSAAIEHKRFWIWEKIRDSGKHAAVPSEKEFVAGESSLFLGQNYRLGVTDNSRGKVQLNGRHFELSLRDRSKGRQLFREWFHTEARKHIPPRAAHHAKTMGVRFKRILVRDLKYRWGSCTPKGTLTFNWRIVQAPAFVLDYTIVHELAHLMEPSHSPQFWNIVAVHVPSWEKAKSWLKRYGSRLEW